jgi:hypothetical protein
MTTMPTTKRSIKVFYAWQSDLPAKFNRTAVKKCLRLASGELEGQLSTETQQAVVVIDEATRDCPGSPNIPASILEKIQASDVFVADVSITNSKSDDKATPNPNVVFELGYAVANLGWERVILLINEAHGKMELLPFDFDRHRATPFTLAEGKGNSKELTKTLTDAISLIISKDPPRPKTGRFNLAEAERERDLTNLRWLLGSINWPTIDEHISSGPKFLSAAGTHFYDEVISIVSSTLFHIYDRGLKKRIQAFVEHWTGSVKFDHYVPLPGERTYIFKPGHPSQRIRENNEFDYMERERLKMYAAMNELLAVIRTKFPEIDLMALSNSAGRRYDAQMAEFKERFSRPLVIAKGGSKGKKGT